MQKGDNMRKQLNRILELQVLVISKPHLKGAYLAYIEDFCNRYGVSIDEAKKELLS